VLQGDNGIFKTLVTMLVDFILLHLHVAGPPQRVLSSFLHSFVNSSHDGIPFRPASLPLLGLSQGDKQCIRDRSGIMARHFFADKSEDFINAQV
jgi:peroxin-5